MRSPGSECWPASAPKARRLARVSRERANFSGLNKFGNNYDHDRFYQRDDGNYWNGGDRAGIGSRWEMTAPIFNFIEQPNMRGKDQGGGLFSTEDKGTKGNGGDWRLKSAQIFLTEQ